RGDAARRGAGRGRAPRGKARRTARQAVPAAGAVEGAERLPAGVRARQGRGAAPPQPVHLLAADVAPAEHGGVRRAGPRGVRRQTTSTPLQPLVLLNDPQFVEAARALGERMLREGGATVEDRAAYAFRLAATRRPSDQEVRLLAELYREQLALFRNDPEGARKF